MLITAISSMLMSNMATRAMMIASTSPIVYKLGIKAALTKVHFIGTPSATAIGGTGTIISTASNAIAYSTRQLEQSNFRFGGVLIGFLGSFLLLHGFFFLNLSVKINFTKRILIEKTANPNNALFLQYGKKEKYQKILRKH